MNVNDIEPGKTYRGGQNGDLRHVIKWGADETYVVWSLERNRLPLGGFVDGRRCTTRVAFARWAIERVRTKWDKD